MTANTTTPLDLRLARAVERATRACNGPYNLAPLAGVRYHLACYGLTHAEQDVAIQHARALGLVTATPCERDVTEEQRAAAVREDGRLLGYLSLKEGR